MVIRCLLLALAALLCAPVLVTAQNAPPPGMGARPIQASDLIRVTPRREPNGQKPAPEIQLKIEGFLKKLQGGQVKEAYVQLLTGSRIAQQPDKVELLIAKTNQAFGVYGKMIRYEAFDSYEVGSSIVVSTYLTNLPVQPLRWRFVYYKPANEWTIIDVRVDDVLNDLLNE